MWYRTPARAKEVPAGLRLIGVYTTNGYPSSSIRSITICKGKRFFELVHSRRWGIQASQLAELFAS